LQHPIFAGTIDRFDALVFTPEALPHLAAQVGASQIVLGSDHPFPWEEHPVDHILGAPVGPRDAAPRATGSAFPNTLVTGKITGNLQNSGLLRRFWQPVREKIQSIAPNSLADRNREKFFC